MKKAIYFTCAPALLAFLLMSFAPTMVPATADFATVTLGPNAPTTPPLMRISTNGVSYLGFAVSSFHPADGFEWTLQGGTITSGNGTHAIQVVPNCINGSLLVEVRAYNLNPDGTRCYSGTLSKSYTWTGPCLE